MSLPDEIAADIAALELEIPAVFVWQGDPYPCLRGSLRRNRNLEAGGFGLDADLILFVRTVHFGGERPTSKQKITFNSRHYRIDDVIVPAGEPFLKLVCSDSVQGA